MKVFPLQDRAISEANLTLLLVLVTSMNQYEAPALIDVDAISENRTYKRRRNSLEGKSVVSYMTPNQRVTDIFLDSPYSSDQRSNDVERYGKMFEILTY